MSTLCDIHASPHSMSAMSPLEWTARVNEPPSSLPSSQAISLPEDGGGGEVVGVVGAGAEVVTKEADE